MTVQLKVVIWVTYILTTWIGLAPVRWLNQFRIDKPRCRFSSFNDKTRSNVLRVSLHIPNTPNVSAASNPVSVSGSLPTEVDDKFDEPLLSLENLDGFSFELLLCVSSILANLKIIFAPFTPYGSSSDNLNSSGITLFNVLLSPHIEDSSLNSSLNMLDI